MAAIADYQQAWKGANARGDKAEMDAAHKGAETIRNQQGYSGGPGGSVDYKALQPHYEELAKGKVASLTLGRVSLGIGSEASQAPADPQSVPQSRHARISLMLKLQQSNTNKV